MNSILPEHINISLKAGAQCTGKNVTDKYEDIGVTVGTCPVCRQAFVYLAGSDRWVSETEFETAKQKLSPQLSKFL